MHDAELFKAACFYQACYDVCMTVILLVEDDPQIRSSLVQYLSQNDFHTDCAGSVEEAEAYLLERSPDLILLDVTLPDGSGFDFCRSLDKKIPVIFLTASDDERSLITGYDLGADDYITKPFNPRILLSRIHNVLNRYQNTKVLEKDGLAVNLTSGQVERDHREIALTPMEYHLLEIFCENQNKLLTREYLLDEIVDLAGDYVNANTLNVYIKRLRKKIERDPAHPVIIQTVRGLGYKMP